MTERRNPHTFLAWAQAHVGWDAERWERLHGLFVGVLPSALAEGARMLARMMLPVDGTNPESIPHMLRLFGLPAYRAEEPLTDPAGYFAALARIRDAWNTHGTAGATAMLETELARAGVAGASIANLSGATEGADFAISVPTSTAGAEYGNGTPGPTVIQFDDGNTYDRQITATESQGIRAVIAYFKPARSLFRRLDP